MMTLVTKQAGVYYWLYRDWSPWDIRRYGVMYNKLIPVDLKGAYEVVSVANSNKMSLGYWTLYKT